MPPPDTAIYIPGQTGPPPAAVDPYVDSVIEINQQPYDGVREGESSRPFDGPAMFLIFMIGIALAIITNYISLVPGFIRRRITAAEVRKLVGERGEACHQLLMDCNPYYRNLPDTLKQRFIARTLHFANSKQFHFHSMEEEEHVPILVSGAAVQLTFGLHNYLLDYFDTIHIMQREYVLSVDNDTYLGHVSKNGIHLSWGHFLQGYQYYSDSVNLGLHEMAHALQYDAVLGFENQYDRTFKERMSSFHAEGLPVFRAMRTGMNAVFSDYSTTNFDEFWAVSVENFFENPSVFKERLPALYQEMCELLNQDPMLEHKIIDPDLV